MARYDFPRLLPLLPGNPTPSPMPVFSGSCAWHTSVIHWTSSIPALTGPVSSQTSHFTCWSFLFSWAPGLCLRGLTHKEEIKGTSEKHHFEADVLGSNSGSLFLRLLIFKDILPQLASYLGSPCMYIMNSDCSPQYRLLFSLTPLHPFLRFPTFGFVLWPI